MRFVLGGGGSKDALWFLHETGYDRPLEEVFLYDFEVNNCVGGLKKHPGGHLSGRKNVVRFAIHTEARNEKFHGTGCDLITHGTVTHSYADSGRRAPPQTHPFGGKTALRINGKTP